MHLIFEIIVAAIVLAFWIPSFYLPILQSYKRYYGPLNLIFSYLWLTSFIFAAEDYNQNTCGANSPNGGSCNLKLTSEAFIFVAFFFSLLGAIIDAYAWKLAAVMAAEPVHPEKPVEAPAPTANV